MTPTQAHEGHNPKERTMESTNRKVSEIQFAIRTLRMGEHALYVQIRRQGIKHNDAMRAIENKRSRNTDTRDVFQEQSNRRTCVGVVVNA
jgi:hypothetical protein